VRDPSFDLHALLHDVCFPHLRALALDILTPEAPSNACALAMLLERTPMLQHATWKHLDPDVLSAGALPALRMLHVEGVPCSPGAAGRALLRGGASLDVLGSVCVDVLGSVCMDADALEALAHMHGEALRHLEVASFESIAVLVRAVRLFPCLRWLRMPTVDYWHEHSPVTPAPVHLVRPSRQYMRLSVCADERVWGRASGSRCLRHCPSLRSSAGFRSSAILRVPRLRRMTSTRAIS